MKELSGVPAPGDSPAAAMNLRGLAEMLAGNAPDALAAFDKGLVLEPKMQALHMNRGVALLKLDHLAEASAEFEALYGDEASPFRARAAYHNGLVKDRLGRLDEAAEWVERATALQGEYVDAFFYLGVIRERQGDMQAAGRAYKTVLDRDPAAVAAILRFGICAQRSGRTDVALTYLHRVIKLAPDSEDAVEARKYIVMWE